MNSPLTQQARPDVFEPKVVGLYRSLFREVEDDDKDASFWATLFLLKPDTVALKEILENTDAEFLLHVPNQPQRLLLQALARVKSAEAPADEYALETLTVFFAEILGKKFLNPSSDIIEVLAGLDNADAVFSDLVAILESTIKDGRSHQVREKGVQTAMAVVSGGYQTALVSYFVHRDLFPALMKMVHQAENPLKAAEPFLLTGLLANYNKFEVSNQYRMRFADFVNEETMTRVVHSIAWTTTILREQYTSILDDTPAGWSLSSTLSYVGLGAVAGSRSATPALTEEQQKQLFAAQPGPHAAALLTVYDFVLSNKLFCHHLVAQQAFEKGQAPPFSCILSFISYLYQHAHGSLRASLYSYLTLIILTILVEDGNIAKLLCETSGKVRHCRQRPPHLPLSTGERPYMVSMIDIVVDGINHNLRKRLDTAFYYQGIFVLLRVLSFMARSKTQLTYHWAELWRSLLSFARFLTVYAEELAVLPGTKNVVELLVDVLMIALASGEAFLPDSAAYDDLFYKLVESGDTLAKLRDLYHLSDADDLATPINTLIGVSKHYDELIATQKSKSTHLTSRQVSQIIKQGYDTLSIEAKEGLSHVDNFREVDFKTQLKKITRIAVNDAASLVTL